MAYAAAYWSVLPDQAGLACLLSQGLLSLSMAAAVFCVCIWSMKGLGIVHQDYLLSRISNSSGRLLQVKGICCIQKTMVVI